MTKNEYDSFSQSPLRLIISIVLSIFIAESLVMALLAFFPALPRQTVIFIDSGLLLMFLTPSLYFFVFRPLLLHITERKRAEEALRESERQLRALSARILTAQETERKRIARQLHEELGQVMPVLKMQLRMIEKRLSKDKGEMKEDFEDILSNIDQVIEGVRNLSQSLSPSALEDFGVSAALQSLIAESTARYDTHIALDTDDIDHLLSPNARVSVFRILQEALSNAGRHACAKNIRIAIKKEDKGISVTIEDDGKGFDVNKAPSREAAEDGWGLSLMTERVQMLGGSFHVWSQEGKGTRIAFTVPLEK